MGKAKARRASESPIRTRKAISPEAREQQLTALAYDLVEQKLRDGTATSQETTHFLKIGSMKHQEELEKLRRENELLKAKTEALESAKRSEEMFAEAMKAFSSYQGNFSEEEDEFYD